MAAPSDVVTPDLAGTGYDVQQRRPGQQYRFTLEEMRVLKECNRESFYYRCVPIAATTSIAVHYAVRAGYLTPHPRFGSSIKMIGACFVGWIVGKLSYQGKCEEKLMQLPGSPIGEALRRKRGFAPTESLSDSQSSNAYDLSMAEPRYPSQGYSPSSGALNLDVDKNAPYRGLDDSQRPSLDNPHASPESERPPAPKPSTTYEELRNRNREEYERRHLGPRHQLPGSAPHVQGPSPPRHQLGGDQEFGTRSNATSTSASTPARSTGAKRNLYGDTWDD